MIVALGDSITYGQLLPDWTKAWPRLLDVGHLVSMGVPGDTTRLGLERFPADVQDYQPDIVIIQFGHNDANRWQTDRGLPRVSLPAYKANLVEMIDRCRRFDAKPFLCTLTPCYRNDQHTIDCDMYDRALRRVADDEAVPLIDVRAAFLADETASLLLEDKLHLSEAGHCLYAKTVQQALDREAIE